jgi:TRAP transporter TAXI family solute receptor
VLIAGHPNAAVARATERCGAVIVPVAGPTVERAFAGSSDFVRSTIPAGAYPGVAADIPSFAVTATVITRADMDAETVEALVAGTLTALPALALRSPLLAGLSPTDMRTRGFTAPLHPGAQAAFSAAAAGG